MNIKICENCDDCMRFGEGFFIENEIESATACNLHSMNELDENDYVSSSHKYVIFTENKDSQISINSKFEMPDSCPYQLEHCLSSELK